MINDFREDILIEGLYHMLIYVISYKTYYQSNHFYFIKYGYLVLVLLSTSHFSKFFFKIIDKNNRLPVVLIIFINNFYS